MAQRPVFYVNTRSPYYNEELISFQFNPGFAVSQKQKNIRAIHEAFILRHKNARPLEISSKSEESAGVQLSAFNLPVTINGFQTTVESAFQGSKVFRDGGPYEDILCLPPYEAKTDSRLRESGPLTGFLLDGLSFPLEPKTFFYDWLYINAVMVNVIFRLTKVLFQFENSLNFFLLFLYYPRDILIIRFFRIEWIRIIFEPSTQRVGKAFRKGF